MLAKLLFEKLDQSAAMPRFLFAHALEHGRRSGIILAQTFGKVGVHAFVFFFQRDGESQHFAFAEFVKLFHAALAYLPEHGGDKCVLQACEGNDAVPLENPSMHVPMATFDATIHYSFHDAPKISSPQDS